MPRSPFASPSLSLSPTPSGRKATAVFRKRQRGESAEDVMRMGPRVSYHPYLTRRRREEIAPSWSSVSKVTDEEEEEDEAEEEEETSSSPFKQIQVRVDQVHAQVAQARRDVAELRALLLRVAASSQLRPRAQLAPLRTSKASPARVSIDMLCS